MVQAIPALPVSDLERSIVFYRDKIGFTLRHHEGGFAMFEREAVEIHLWSADDDAWRTRDGSSPVVSGAESFIAGTSSCRIGVEGVDELYRRVEAYDILHSNADLADKPWGTREFGVVDPDGNLITFFERSKSKGAA